MIEFGMPTLIELDDIEQCAALCAECGLKFIELNMNLPSYQTDTIDCDRLRAVAEKYGLYYTIHLDENTDPCVFNKYIRDGYIRTVAETIEIAKRLGVPVLNMHLSRGVHFTMPDKKIFLYDRYSPQYLQLMQEFGVACEKQIGNSDIKICIENSDGYTDFQVRALDILLSHRVFALTFDIGHNHSISGADEPIILEREDRLAHFHFHDAVGKRNHLALGEGEIDVGKYLELAKRRNGRIVLETKTVDGLRRSAKYILSK